MLIFVMSTGRCGTAFLAYIFSCAEQVVSYHQPISVWREANRIANAWKTDSEEYRRLVSTNREAPGYDAVRRLFESSPSHVCVTDNSCFPYIELLKRAGAHLIHLVRQPISWSESELSVRPTGLSHDRPASFYETRLEPAARAAAMWLNINTMIAHALSDYDRSYLLRTEELSSSALSDILLRLGVTHGADLSLVAQDRNYVASPHYGGSRSIGNTHNKIGRRLSVGEIAVVQDITASLAANLGY